MPSVEPDISGLLVNMRFSSFNVQPKGSLARSRIGNNSGAYPFGARSLVTPATDRSFNAFVLTEVKKKRCRRGHRFVS